MLLDLKLPKVTGLEVLRRIREDDETRVIPVVIFTSSCEPNDIRACYALGANSFVVKPVDYIKYSDDLKEVVNYWLKLNKPPLTMDEPD